MNKLPTFPIPKPQNSINNKSLFSDNIRTLITLVYDSSLNQDVKFDILDSLTHLAVDQCPKNESESWADFRTKLFEGTYSDIGKTPMGKGYYFWYKDGSLFVNRVNPLPSDIVKSKMIDLGFRLSDKLDKSTGIKELFWVIKLSQVKAKSQVVFAKLQTAIASEA